MVIISLQTKFGLCTDISDVQRRQLSSEYGLVDRTNAATEIRKVTDPGRIPTHAGMHSGDFALFVGL